MLMIEQNAKRALENSDYRHRARARPHAHRRIAPRQHPRRPAHRPAVSRRRAGACRGRAPRHLIACVASGGETDMNAVASRNIKFVSHSDLGGRGDGVQIMVHRGYAYVGHGFSNGITTVDVRDAKNPQGGRLHRLPAGHARLSPADPRRPAAGGQRAERVDHAGIPEREGLFRRLAGGQAEGPEPVHRRHPGLRHLQAARSRPRSASCRSKGSGRTASGTPAGATPMPPSISPISPTTFSRSSTCPTRSKPQVVGRWWLPGMWRAGGETPTWRERQALCPASCPGRPATSPMPPGATAV